MPKGHNPAEDVPNLKIKKNEPEIWASEDLSKAFNHYLNSEEEKYHSRIIFLALGAYAGMRPSEIEGVAGERDGLHWSDIDFERKHIRIRPEVAGKLSEPRYIMFTAKPNSGLSEELAEQIWGCLSSFLLPLKKESGPVTIRRAQRSISSELREAEVIDYWPTDGLRHTWISSLLALGVHREWIAEIAGNSPEIIRTNYKRPLPEDIAKSWFHRICNSG